MKEVSIIFFIVSLIVVWAVLSGREGFVPEFLDTSNQKRTTKLKDSSYNQTTNHAIPNKQIDLPIQGIETSYRVNMFNSFVP
jgi:hypothetical protein